MDESTEIERLTAVHAEAAKRRLADTPFADGVMPVYADLYLDGEPFVSVAVVPDDRAFGDICALARTLNADAIVFTTDTYITTADTELDSAATIPSRFEVGDPTVFEALSVTAGSLDEGILLVQIPYARSLMDGLEFHEPMTTGLDSLDTIQGSITDALVTALNGVTDDEATLGLMDLLDGATLAGNRMAVLLHDTEHRAVFGGGHTGWARTRYGLANVDESTSLVDLLAACRAA